MSASRLGPQVVPTGLGTDGTLSLSVFSPVGVRRDGTAYFDPNGAAAGEAAVLVPNPSTGGVFPVRIGG